MINETLESARDSPNDDLIDFTVPDDDGPIMRHQVPPTNMAMPPIGGATTDSELYTVPKMQLGGP